jgi:hypothetical protein
MKRLMLWLAVAVLLFSGTAYGQTTQPAEQPWPKAANALSKALAATDTGSLASLLAEGAVIRAFDSKADNIVALLARTEKSQVIGAFADFHEPQSMAATIAAAFKTSPIVPDAIKRQMVPENEAVPRANATAVQWLAAELGAKAGDPVAILVFWAPATDAPTAEPGNETASANMELVFVLVRGEETSAKTFRAKALVFGNPLTR